MLKIGWSKRDVSTLDPVMITGQFHVRVSKGILDPIMIYSLVLEDGNDVAIFLCGDFVSGRCSLPKIREKVAKRNPEIPVNKILFNITHTHCGPALNSVNQWKDVPHEGLDVTEPAEYVDFFTDQAADAIIEAYENRKPGAIAFGYGYAVVSHSRRVTYYDDISLRSSSTAPALKSLSVNGHAVMYGNTNDDQFAGYENGADHFVNLMYTFDTEGKLTGAVVNVPCPSQNSEQESWLTADYWHDVRTILKEKYGDIYVLSQCAAAGDLAPRILHYKNAQARRYALKYETRQLNENAANKTELLNRADIAERICAAFDEVLAWAKKDLRYEAPIRHTVRDIDVERWLISDDDYNFAVTELAKISHFEFQNTGDPRADYHANTKLVTAQSRFQNIIDRYNLQKEYPMGKVELHAIQVGDIAFVSNPFELYMDYQHQIQARSPYIQTFVIQLCDVPGKEYPSGYLATDRGEANVGYSANIYSNQVSYKGGQSLVRETLKALNEMAE